MKTFTLTATVLALSIGTLALADGHADIHPAVKARQAHMQLYAHNLGILGGMAQAKTEYDAAAAQTAADNLVALVAINQSTYWPAGTDNSELEGTKALPALWENFDNVMAIGADMVAATDAMAAAAGTDLASLQGAMPALGGACSACHREYRER